MRIILMFKIFLFYFSVIFGLTISELESLDPTALKTAISSLSNLEELDVSVVCIVFSLCHWVL